MTKTTSDKSGGIKLICQNRKAFHDYEIVETLEAGMVLVGTEVKSLREGRANLKDSYARIKRSEVFLYDLHISPYSHASHDNHDPERVRKLLLHRQEIKRLLGKTQERLLPHPPEDLLQGRQGQGRDCSGPGQESL